MKEPLWQCPLCREHFYERIIDEGRPVCAHAMKDCPAKQEAKRRAEEKS